MKTKLTQALIGSFIAVLFGSQAVANSQIKEDFAYAFGSSEGLDSGNITPLSSQEMDEVEGQFIGWLIRMGPRAIREFVDALKIVRVELREWRKKNVDVWIRIGESKSRLGGFETSAIRWGSNRHHRDKNIQNWHLREFNRRLHETRIPIRSWRTNDPGHLHIRKLPPRPPRPPSPPRTPKNSEPSSFSMSNEDSAPIYSPERHNGEGGVISSIDWETITAEDLLTGRYDQSILEEAATGPKGTGRVAEEWGMETLTERQVALGLSILLFVTDPRNNADIDIPLDLSWEHYRMAVHLRRNPKKNQRIARMAELGLKQLEYIIGQHSQNYHNIEETPSTEVPPGADALTETVALTEASPSSPETSTDQNTYLPIQAHWWMHEFSGR